FTYEKEILKYFFFQAEDGIRDGHVTGVQTCALPIFKEQNHFEVLAINDKADAGQVKLAYFKLAKLHHPDTVPEDAPPEFGQLKRSEERRVGKEWSYQWSRSYYIER